MNETAKVFLQISSSVQPYLHIQNLTCVSYYKDNSLKKKIFERLSFNQYKYVIYQFYH